MLLYSIHPMFDLFLTKYIFCKVNYLNKPVNNQHTMVTIQQHYELEPKLKTYVILTTVTTNTLMYLLTSVRCCDGRWETSPGRSARSVRSASSFSRGRPR